MRIDRLVVSSLPRRWYDVPAPQALQKIGDEWVRSGAGVGLAVPSAVVSVEENVLFNPAHADFSKLQLGTPGGLRD